MMKYAKKVLVRVVGTGVSCVVTLSRKNSFKRMNDSGAELSTQPSSN
jgi:hypothetical protein